MEWFWSLVLPLLSSLIIVIINNQIILKRLPYQNKESNANANSETMDAYELVVKRLAVLEKENIQLKTLKEGKIIITIETTVDAVLKNKKATITGTVEVVPPS